MPQHWLKCPWTSRSSSDIEIPSISLKSCTVSRNLRAYLPALIRYFATALSAGWTPSMAASECALRRAWKERFSLSPAIRNNIWDFTVLTSASSPCIMSSNYPNVLGNASSIATPSHLPSLPDKSTPTWSLSKLVQCSPDHFHIVTIDFATGLLEVDFCSAFPSVAVKFPNEFCNCPNGMAPMYSDGLRPFWTWNRRVPTSIISDRLNLLDSCGRHYFESLGHRF